MATALKILQWILTFFGFGAKAAGEKQQAASETAATAKTEAAIAQAESDSPHSQKEVENALDKDIF
jgi:hypothetical protein